VDLNLALDASEALEHPHCSPAPSAFFVQ